MPNIEGFLTIIKNKENLGLIVLSSTSLILFVVLVFLFYSYFKVQPKPLEIYYEEPIEPTAGCSINRPKCNSMSFNNPNMVMNYSCGIFDDSCQFCWDENCNATVQAVEIIEYNSSGGEEARNWVYLNGAAPCGIQSTGVSCSGGTSGGTCTVDVINPNKIVQDGCDWWVKDADTARITLNVEMTSGRQMCEAYRCTTVISINNPPTCNSFSVSPGNTIYVNNSFQFSANVSDDHGIDHVRFYRQRTGQDYCNDPWTLISLDNTSPYVSSYWNVGSGDVGTWWVAALVYDTNGAICSGHPGGCCAITNCAACPNCRVQVEVLPAVSPSPSPSRSPSPSPRISPSPSPSRSPSPSPRISPSPSPSRSPSPSPIISPSPSPSRSPSPSPIISPSPSPSRSPSPSPIISPSPSPWSESCAICNINGDTEIGYGDLTYLLNNWDDPDPATPDREDTFSLLLCILYNWGTPCSSQ